MSRARHVKALRVVLVALFVAMSWRVFRFVVGAPVVERRGQFSIWITARDGRVLRELPGCEGTFGHEISLEAIGPRFVTAMVVAEDKRFHSHDGIDRAGIVRAAFQNIVARKRVSGGSTVTQQLVKLIDHNGDRSWWTKLVEAARAQNLESSYDKNAILSAYLNRLPFGRQIVGIDAAARTYFGVSPSELSWAQATFLAVVPRAPSRLDPIRHKERVIVRQRVLLKRLHASHQMDEPSLANALAEVVSPRIVPRPFEVPHLSEWLRVRGAVRGDTQTSIDRDLQHETELAVRAHLSTFPGRRAGSAAAIVIDNLRSEVLAWVGNRDVHDKHGHIDFVRAPRQPGSTLKPFVYSSALERGHSNLELLNDAPIRFRGTDGGFQPVNFDGEFQGPVLVNQALAASLNLPVLRLAAQLPKGTFLDQLRALGFQHLTRSEAHYGLSLVLGSAEVPLIELANAYATLARGGLIADLSVVGSHWGVPTRRALSAESAAEITEALVDPTARLELLHGPVDLGFSFALKTGTSSGFRDAWAVVYTHERTVAVWVGNADREAMDELTGAAAALPIATRVLQFAMQSVRKREPLVDGSLLQSGEVCGLSGKRPSRDCPHRVRVRFRKGQAKGKACDLHRRVRVEGRHYRCDARGDRVVAVMPTQGDAWQSWRASGTPWISESELTNCGSDSRAPWAQIVEPTDGSVVTRANPEAAYGFVLHAEVPSNTDRVEVFVDGRSAGILRAPFRRFVRAAPGDHELTLRGAANSHAVRFALR